MIWTRSGTVWHTQHKHITPVRHTHTECRERTYQIITCVFVSHTFLNHSSVSGLRSHSSVMSTTAPCNTPSDKQRQNQKESSDILWDKLSNVKLTSRRIRTACDWPWFFSARRERAAGVKSSPRSWTFLTMWTAHRAAWKNISTITSSLLSTGDSE